ncbi:MAG: YibE/F family protein [Kiritimatiellales bacterium]
MKDFLHISRRDAVMVSVFLLLCGILAAIDIFPKKNPEPGRKERAMVVRVDNSDLEYFGLLLKGSQLLEVEVRSGKWRGERFPAVNQLRAQMELDKTFKIGDTVLVGVLENARPGITTLNAQDHYRIGYTLLLAGLFGLFLILFGGIIGFNALLSFVFSCLMIWKLVIPLCLSGWNALAVTFGAVTLLSAAIIFLVAGLNRKGVTAFSGAIMGVFASSVMAYLFTHLFKINGAVMPYSQALLYSGYEFLSLPDIYIGAIFLSSAGAVMDLGMDVAVGMDELIRKKPDLPRRELFRSGMRMGRNVVGTMTTTLLLAYSGGYLTLMMTFAAQGTNPVDFINNPYVASEAVKTLVGSFGLVLVAPFTALTGSLWLRAPPNSK